MATSTGRAEANSSEMIRDNSQKRKHCEMFSTRSSTMWLSVDWFLAVSEAEDPSWSRQQESILRTKEKKECWGVEQKKTRSCDVWLIIKHQPPNWRATSTNDQHLKYGRHYVYVKAKCMPYRTVPFEQFIEPPIKQPTTPEPRIFRFQHAFYYIPRTT